MVIKDMSAKKILGNFSKSGASKVSKYLTEIKELPPTFKEEKKEKILKEEPDNQAEKSETKNNISDKEVTLNDQEIKKEVVKETPQEERESDEMEEKPKLPISSRDVILGIVNLISILLLIFILVNFPKKSEELKKLKIENLKNESNITFKVPELEESKLKADKLNELFLDESGIVDFVNKVEMIKTEGGALSKVSFANQKVVKDRTGNFGIPLVIELNGNWETINKDLQKIDVIPNLFRPANVEIKHSDKDPEMIIFKYGIFLYVNEKLGEIR